MEVLTVMTGEAKGMEQMTLGQMSLFQEQVNMRLKQERFRVI